MNIPSYSLAVLGLFFWALVGAAQDKPAENAAPKDPYAIGLIQRAASYLAGQEHFSVQSEIWDDMFVEGSLLQFDRTVEVVVRRPDRIRMDISTTIPTRSIFYDGDTVTMVDQRTNQYGVTKGAGSIDETITMIDSKYDVEFPMEDLLFSKPFGNAAETALGAQYLGKTVILGVECDHVAFQHQVLDWQAWIATGPVPTLRKVVIDYKRPTNNPRTTAIFSDWDFTTPMPDFVFEFTPMAYQDEIEVLPQTSPMAPRK
ncbi:MAG: DUF2092 domain-containing protein [Verrucomicrobiota bacterium]